MKTKKTNVMLCPQTGTVFSKSASKYLLGSLAAVAALPLTATSVRADDASSKADALVNFEFSDHYLTPRGMIVQNKGLVFQQLVLGFFQIYKGDNAYFNSATVVGGVWNCFGTGMLPSSESGGAKGTSWYEIDPIAGLSFGLMKHATLDVTYTDFNMQIFNIPFSQHLDTKLSLDDSPWLKAFALHPYVEFWDELDGKAVASNNTGTPKSSFYFDLGVTPSYTFDKIGLKFETPCRVLLPDSNFYGTVPDSSSVGLYEVGIKATIPLKFMPTGYGHWSFHAGFKYMGFESDNLKATQHSSGSTAVYCGLTSFF